ncbi:MAG: alanine racemase [Candidatus Marinamargulisbacteria bacterium]|jgi:alanine racemase
MKINGSNYKSNIASLKALTAEHMSFLESTNTSEIMAVIKANAYGHGLTYLAKKAIDSGAKKIAVARFEEAMALRELGFTSPIQIFSAVNSHQIPDVIAQDLSILVWDIDQLKDFSKIAQSTGNPLKVWIKIDTGMHRLGVFADDLPALLTHITPHTVVSGVMTHLSTADEKDTTFSTTQLHRFLDALDIYASKRALPHAISFANSATCINFRKIVDTPLKNRFQKLLNANPDLNIIFRCGIACFGVQPGPDTCLPDTLKPVLTWQSPFTRSDNSPSAMPLGYLDGLSPQWPLIGIKNQKYSLSTVGANVSYIDKAEGSRSEEASLIDESIPVRAISEEIGSINYEVLCTIGSLNNTRQTEVRLEENQTTNRLHINLANFNANIAVLRKQAQVPIIADLAHNAYGHGLKPLAYRCLKQNISQFSVKYLADSQLIHTLDKHARIFLNQPLLSTSSVNETVTDSYNENLIILASCVRTLKELSHTGQLRNKRVSVALVKQSAPEKIGLSEKDLSEALALDLPHVSIVGILIDAADSESPGDLLATFMAETESRAPLARWALNLSPTQVLPQALSGASCPLSLFGLADPFKPLLSWTADISQVKKVKAGDFVSYGNSYTFTADSTIAVIPVGYGDGFPRSPLNWGYVTRNQATYPLVGHVTMDQSIILITDEAAKPGDRVELIGRSQTAAQVAKRLKKGPLALLCHLSERLPRIYR